MGEYPITGRCWLNGWVPPVVRQQVSRGDRAGSSGNVTHPVTGTPCLQGGRSHRCGADSAGNVTRNPIRHSALAGGHAASPRTDPRHRRHRPPGTHGRGFEQIQESCPGYSCRSTEPCVADDEVGDGRVARGRDRRVGSTRQYVANFVAGGSAGTTPAAPNAVRTVETAASAHANTVRDHHYRSPYEWPVIAVCNSVAPGARIWPTRTQVRAGCLEMSVTLIFVRVSMPAC